MVVITNYHKLGGFKEQNFIFSQLRMQEPGIQVLAGLMTSGDPERETIPCQSPNAVAVWLVCLSLSNLWLHPHIAFFSESLCILWGYSVTICYDLISILTLITFAKTLFPNKVTFWGSVCRHEFGGKHHSSHCGYQPIHFPNRNGMSPVILYIYMIIKYMQDLFFSFALKILFLIGG